MKKILFLIITILLSSCADGNTTKPFALPQEYPDFYDNCLKSFNIPELSKGAVPFSTKDVESVLKKDSEPFD